MSDGVDPTTGPGGGADEADEAPDRTVGLVAGTEDSTPLLFRVAVAEHAYLQLDDVVLTVRDVPGIGPVSTAGVVTQVRARHEGASFGSDTFLIADGVLPAHLQEIAEVTTTRVEPECYIPPRPGTLAVRAAGLERDRALYFDQMATKLPIGLGRDGEPIYLNLEFLDGTRGAHVSISGISGVATKTSFALFLLHALFTSGVLGKRQLSTRALIFSVKGEDLLFLDQPNVRLDDDLRADYAALGLPATPFGSVGFFAPPVPYDQTGRPNVTGRTSGVSAFWWTLAEFCRDELLPYVFADVEDERNQYTMVVHQVATRLARDAHPAGRDGAVSVDGRIARTWPELVDLVADKVSDDATRAAWAGPVTGIGTVNAFIRRLRSSVRPLSPILRGDLTETSGRTIDTGNQQVTVIDLNTLPERAQRFVVGVTVSAETARKEKAGPGRSALHHDRRAEQVRPARGQLADQGPAAGHRRTRSLARHHPDRRTADRQRGRAPDRVELVDQDRRAARPGRGRPARVRLPAGLAATARDPGQTGRDVRLAAGDPGAVGHRVPLPGVGDPAQRVRGASHDPDARLDGTQRVRPPAPADLDDDDGIDPPPPF